MKAKLVRRSSSNGLVEIDDNVPLGKEYDIDPMQRRLFQAVHISTGTPHVIEMVRTVGSLDDGGWMPVDLLDWPGKVQ